MFPSWGWWHFYINKNVNLVTDCYHYFKLNILITVNLIYCGSISSFSWLPVQRLRGREWLDTLKSITRLQGIINMAWGKSCWIDNFLIYLIDIVRLIFYTLLYGWCLWLLDSEGSNNMKCFLIHIKLILFPLHSLFIHSFNHFCF